MRLSYVRGGAESPGPLSVTQTHWGQQGALPPRQQSQPRPQARGRSHLVPQLQTWSGGRGTLGE